MDNLSEVAAAAKKLAFSEIEKYGIPERGAFEFTAKKTAELAEKLGVDKEIALVGFYLADLKTGQAFEEKRPEDHVKMGLEETKKFLRGQNLDKDVERKIINCVEAHHRDVPYRCKEAEVVANADCYPFLHPRALFHLISGVDWPFEEFMKLLKDKVEEKWDKLSLEICRKELRPYYRAIKTLLEAI